MDPRDRPNRKEKDVKKAKENPIPGRLNLLRAMMEETGVSTLLINSPENRRYFSGFKSDDHMITESSGVLLITLDKQHLLTDSRYTVAAQKEAPLFNIVTYGRSVPLALKGLVKSSDKLFFEPEYVSYGFYRELCSVLGEDTPHTLPFSLGRFRVVKSEDELNLIKKAVQITEKALGEVWNDLEPGVTEEWVSNFLEFRFRELGADGPAFPSIVAAGANGALPHAVPGRKKIGKTEMCIIDIGAKYQGYCSDMTRTWSTYYPTAKQKTIYSVVREAQLLAIAAIKEGVTGAEVDKVARDHIAKEGFGDYFKHSLGHGVGLLVHEEPRLSPGSNVPLQTGSLVTVEPGIYLPGVGGVRLEELVLVRPLGAVILNKDPHFYDFS
jgi:Xaa-Pro aminopeptidase